MKLSAVISYRDCIRTGYPFLESILSVLPIVDEYLINDGGSIDGTLEATKRLVEMYPDKIILFQIKDYPSDHWQCVSEQYNKLLNDATGDWIFMGNADELMHEDDARKFRAKLEASPIDILVYRHLRREVSNWWSEMGSYDYYPARTVRNIEGVFQSWASHGGDEFLVPEWRWLREPPECQTLDGYMMWHYYMMFPENIFEKRKHDSEEVATGDKERMIQYEWWKENKDKIKPPEWYGKKTVPDQPRSMQGLVGALRYYVREEMFDRKWIQEIYEGTVSQ